MDNVSKLLEERMISSFMHEERIERNKNEERVKDS